jgi:hypothetical protein
MDPKGLRWKGPARFACTISRRIRAQHWGPILGSLATLVEKFRRHALNSNWSLSKGRGGSKLLNRGVQGEGSVPETHNQTSQEKAPMSLLAGAGHMAPYGDVPRSTGERLVNSVPVRSQFTNIAGGSMQSTAATSSTLRRLMIRVSPTTEVRTETVKW